MPLREAWCAIATFERRRLIDHDNLEQFADPAGYDRDWNGAPLTAASPSIIVVCRKRA